MNSSFAEKVVLVTDGTSGIWRATAVAFAERGPIFTAAWRGTEGAESARLVDKAGGSRTGSGL
jgi:NAD(P)-dependent dehydrogenase (short-subunit alcohol dehydrogenase family)